eukprot:TRINITY_DN29097_c0_g1_i1.p1 TRINITY_DN29097_c0_g1~~TRINITY_DN29097_c0_g1_i1.p1  ORF type:complete len:750 (-),score=151.15 TRINITY_DN29097_c0_g1_i1:66-2258(-)
MAVNLDDFIDVAASDTNDGGKGHKGGGYGGDSPPRKDGARAPSAQALARWEKDLGIMNTSIKMMLSNRPLEAEQTLTEAMREVEARKIAFEEGEHDLRGGFAFVNALMSLINGLASMENNQLETVLQRVWAADELLNVDRAWAGRTVLKGLTLVVAGLVQIMQGSIPRGIWQILRSWYFLRHLESEGLNFHGHERSCVRSTALLALGVFNLFTSLLPPQAMRAAGWVTGFSGGRDVALQQLNLCWEEGGIQAPFAALALIGFGVDVSSFLGELSAEQEVRHKEARLILDWAAKEHPGAFFFEGLEAAYLAATKDLGAAVQKLENVEEKVVGLPAFLFLVKVRTATFQAARLEWSAAAAAFEAAVDVHRSVPRRAVCPTLAFTAYLCHIAAENMQGAARALEMCRSYRNEEKSWQYHDARSLQLAEVANRLHADLAPREQGDRAAASQDASGGDGSVGSATPSVGNVPPFRPLMELYVKMIVEWRAGNFMTTEQSEAFVALIETETEACGMDLDDRCLGLFVQAEAMRQMESWDEALRLSTQVLDLASQLSARGRKTGAVHFSLLIKAYAHYAKGNAAAAKEALERLDALRGSYEFEKNVEFKATHLRRLVGLHFVDNFQEVSVASRSRIRFVVDVPEDAGKVSWTCILEDFSITFIASFTPSGSEGRPSIELKKLEHHQASSGPIDGSMDVAEPGRLELIFDNTFSMLRGKKLQVQLLPRGLACTKDDRF